MKKKLYIFIGTILFWLRQKKTYIICEYHKSKFEECGCNVNIGHSCEFSHENIKIGNNVFIGSSCFFMASLSKIIIGNNIMFAPHVTIRGGDHRMDIIGKHIIQVTNDEKKSENDQPVIIEDGVWIGTNVTILKGVRVGRGSVIGAGSVVTKDVPPYTIRIGSHDILNIPRFTDAQIKQHEAILECKQTLDEPIGKIL